MPTFEVRSVKRNGITSTMRAEALTIQEHGGEEWQFATNTPDEEDVFYASLRKVSRRVSRQGQAK